MDGKTRMVLHPFSQNSSSCAEGSDAETEGEATPGSDLRGGGGRGARGVQEAQAHPRRGSLIW